MSSVVRPKGPLPPKVYWRRRLVVLAILLAVVVVLVIVFVPRGDASPGRTPGTTSSDPASPADPGVQPTPTPTGGGECDPSRIAITADTDKTEYAAGELPQLWFTLENKTSQPCTTQVGASDSVFSLTSPSGDGDETYWTTADCAATEAAAPVTVTLKPGIPEESGRVTWPRARSTPGDCTLTEPQVGGDGASFDFHVALDGLTATKRIYLY